MELVTEPLTQITNCQESWERIPQLVYGSFTNISQFVIPFITIIICYSKIMVRLGERLKGKPGTRFDSKQIIQNSTHFSRSAQQRQIEAARNRRTNWMLIAMVGIFGACWFPINLINLVADSMDLGNSYTDCNRLISNLQVVGVSITSPSFFPTFWPCPPPATTRCSTLASTPHSRRSSTN